MMDKLIDLLISRLVLTIQQTQAALGPFPDVEGEWLKRVLGKTLKADMPVLIMGLGCALDDCVKQKSFDSLKKFYKDAEERGWT